MMENRRRLYYALLLTGYFGIMVLLLAWYGWLSPPQVLQPAPVIILLALPLFAALRGLLHARLYTVKWSLFLALFYMAHGLIEAWSLQQMRWLGITEVILALCWLIGGIFLVRSTHS